MSAAGRVLALPAFLLSIALFYWSLPLAAITNHVKFMEMRGRRADMYTWARFMTRVFNVRIRKYGTQSMYKAGPAVYLCNHRSWADFFLDTLLTEGSAALMSRWLVYYVFPIFMTSCMVLRGVILFKRGSIADKQVTLTAATTNSLHRRGHRSIKPKSLPLKRGMLHYAHSRQLPVQLIISRGKENVLSEKQRGVHWGVTVVTAYSEVLATSGKGFEEFATEVQVCWDKLWDEVYAARASDLPLLVQDSVPDFDYSPLIRQQQLVTTAASIVILAAVLYATGSLLLAMTAMAGAVMQKPSRCLHRHAPGPLRLLVCPGHLVRAGHVANGFAAPQLPPQPVTSLHRSW
ncbi:hypothetical protein QJQ45_027249 [Haematococcus lacustris]|nr:hypothetical protein QJQ45_027249 [Haematococcus lacustris]